MLALSSRLLGFQLPDGSGLSVPKFAKMLSLVGSLLLVNSPHLTPHGLHRVAAQTCLKAGLSIKELKESGSWKGDSYKSYLANRTIKKGPSALSAMLGEC